MPDPLDERTRQRMRSQGRRDTQPELLVRRRLHGLGYRFRVDFRPEPDLRCSGDIVFTKRKVVVFIDGCFWHGCPQHATGPRNNAQWWEEKLNANVARDGRNTRVLTDRGWTVLRFWEHEQPDQVTARVVEAVGSP